MAQYIDKATVVAEIKRRRKLVSDPILSGNDLMIGERNALFNLLSFIDTLEVKEVNLEKEVVDWWNTYYSNKDYTFEGCNGHYLENSTVIKIAKHFFELGMSVSNKAQKGV